MRNRGKDMKYVVILGDGMADGPIESLGNKTILQAADTPFLDMLSKKYGMIAIKEAVNGTTLVDKDFNSYVNRLKKFTSNSLILYEVFFYGFTRM